MLEALKKNSSFQGRRGPVVLCIADGVGIGKYADGDAVKAASTPVLDELLKTCPNTALKAHGTAVGMPSDDDMGNSEVGHNAIGCGRVFSQGAKLVAEAVETGKLFEGETWKKVIANVLNNNSTLHFLGLFSDGNVHSNINHLKAMVKQAAAEGVKVIRIHALLDGRDVPETSALDYIDPFEEFLAEIRAAGCDAKIASGGGRMKITMDRYNANWAMVEAGWKVHVHGEGKFFASAHEAVVELRKATGAIDQDLDAFVISEDGKSPIGAMKDNDSVIFYNFRGDRSLEITAAFEQDDFAWFDRGVRPNVMYAGMMEYDGDLHAPKNYLVSPPEIDRTLGEYLAASKVRQLAVSETQKYGHVTYFFNGNRSGKFDEALEDYVEVPSDVVPFEERPWMKSAEVTDVVVEAIKSGKYPFIRMNYPNGDMVGHTGDFQAVLVSMGALDIALGRVVKAVKEAGGVLVFSADHGNADDMLEHDKKGEVKLDKKTGAPARKTSHSLNAVPCIIYDPEYKGEYDLKLNEGLGISSLAATCLELMGFEAPEGYDPAVMNMK